jgi:hypothetical protein
MTTAFTHMAHGRPDLAFITQPAGAILSVLSASIFWVALHTATTASRAFPTLFAAIRLRHAVGLLLTILVGWGVTIINFPRS